MSDQSRGDQSRGGARGDDPGNIWRNQPEEARAVNLDQIADRRTRQLSSSTRSEILMSIGAAVLLVGVMAWRLEFARGTLLQFAFAAATVWVAISLYGFRRRIRRPEASPRDAVAATGLDYYRAELERRRDHLRNEWLWQGPLVLAAVILIAVLMGRSNVAFRSLGSIVPLLLLLVAWTIFGIWRRRRQAQDLQREIDDIAPLGKS